VSDISPTPPPFDGSELISIEEEMRRSYLDYAMSVIVSRALPDVRDGLKPVHRRILFSMKESGFDSSKPYKKSARIVGDVMGKYHPHGDSAIYDAMVRMAQDFSMRLPLIDGQGNYGSMDGDPAAAMRYTEARLAKAAEAMLDDIDKETVDFTANYDESAQEPSVIPSRFPNLLVNGAGGIAVGMATNIPPHNLGEVVDACLAYIDDSDISHERLLEIIPGPDFPTGGLILGRSGIRSAYTTSKGSVVMRARTEIEEVREGRQAIIVNEIPYQVNKSKLVERIAEVVREKIVEGISDLRDESDRDGVRVVIEIKRDADPDVVLHQLFRHTPLQTSFGVNMLAIDHGRPRSMDLKDIIAAFVEFREEVVTRRTTFELRKARERAHILAGLLVAISNLDPVIELIRRAPDPATAREQLMATDWEAGDIEPFIALIDDPGRRVVDGKYRLSEVQARAILELRLQRLTGMERDKLTDETAEIAEKIKDFLEILQSRPRRLEVMRDELTAVRLQFATPRRTEILDAEFEHDIEDLIQREDMVVTVTHGGYIKRVPLSTYRAQRRGGKGRTGMAMKDEDFIVNVLVTSTHTPLLFFTSRGMVYQMKVYRLPLGGPTSKGKAMVNLFPLLAADERITALMPLPEDEDSWGQLFAMFATASGGVRRNRLSDFTNIRTNGKIAMKLDEGDTLVAVLPAAEDQDVLLATREGKCIRFPVTEIRVFAGRDSTGNRGIRLAEGDEVISMTMLRHSDDESDMRDLYLRCVASARRLASNGTEPVEPSEDRERDEERARMLTEDPRLIDMAGREEFLLSVSDTGMGLLCSSFDYRVTGRGGQGLTNMDLRGAKVAATFWIDREKDELMLVSDAGQIIRIRVDGIAPKRRGGGGVRVFNIDANQRVVSVARLTDVGEEDGELPEGDEAAVEGTDAPSVVGDNAPGGEVG